MSVPVVQEESDNVTVAVPQELVQRRTVAQIVPEETVDQIIDQPNAQPRNVEQTVDVMQDKLDEVPMIIPEEPLRLPALCNPESEACCSTRTQNLPLECRWVLAC